MTKRIKLGMLTPSSNTALEPITSAMVSGLLSVNIIEYSTMPRLLRGAS